MPASEPIDTTCPACMAESKASLDAFALGLLFGEAMKDATGLMAMCCAGHRVNLHGAVLLANMEARRYVVGMAVWPPEGDDDDELG